MSTEVTEKVSWQDEARKDAGVVESSAMAEVPVLKVYNKAMGNNAVEDPEKAGKILIKRNGGEWEVFGEELNLNVLIVRKFNTGFAPRINEFGDILKDSNQNIIKDFYFTPEVDVFNTDNIPLGRIRKGGSRELLGKSTKMDFTAFCKEPKIDGNINPLFKEVKTNEQTGERYTTSYMKLGYVVYVQDMDTAEIYKIIPGGSYGRFNDIKDGTFEDLKLQAKIKYKEEHEGMVIDSFIKTKVGVKHEGGFYYLDWKLNGFMEDDNRHTVEETKFLIESFNAERFKDVDFDQPLQAIAYKDGLKLEAPKAEKVKDAEEISVSDLPF